MTGYSATHVGEGVWIVKRLRADRDIVDRLYTDEATIYAHEVSAGASADEVINYAIKRGSWA